MTSEDKDSQRLRQIAREVFWELLDSDILPVLRDFVGIRFDAARVPSSPADRVRLPFDLDRIHWEDRENEKGAFQVSEDFSNMDFKNLLRFLNDAGGFVSTKDSEGRLWNVWVYQAGDKIGRKLRQKKEAGK